MNIDPPIDGQDLFELVEHGSRNIYISLPQLLAPPDSI